MKKTLSMILAALLVMSGLCAVPAEQGMFEEDAVVEEQLVGLTADVATDEDEAMEPEEAKPEEAEPEEAEPEEAEEAEPEETETPEADEENEENGTAEEEPEEIIAVTKEEQEAFMEADADVVTATEAFCGKLSVLLFAADPIAEGDIITLKAMVSEANMTYSIDWQRLVNGEGETELKWKTVASGEAYTLTAEKELENVKFRALLTAEDGTTLTSGAITLTIAQEEIAEDVIEEAEEAIQSEAETEETEEVTEAETETEEESTEEETIIIEETAEEESEDTAETEEATEPEETEEAAEPEETEEAAEPEETEEATEPEETEEATEPEETEETAEPEEEIAEPEVKPAPAKAEAAVVIDDYKTPLGEDDFMTISLDALEEDSEVALREEADGLSAILESMGEGSELTVIAIEGDWALVVCGDVQGYVYLGDIADYLEEDADEETVVEKKVLIFSSRRSVMKSGETVKLTSELKGYDGIEVEYCWKCDRHDGLGFVEVEDGNGSEYEFIATAKTLRYDWQLKVTPID